MADWREAMQQTYEYYVVDPETWRDNKLLRTVTSSSITRDSDTDTLGSATIDIADTVGDCYIRKYLVVIQNGVTEKVPLGVFLMQTPSSNFDGKNREVSVDAYTPLIELKEGLPPIGYFVPKGENIMDTAYRLVRENVRAPVVWIEGSCPDTLSNNFVANTDDNWLVFVRDLINEAKYTFDLDEMGRILFIPKKDIESMQAVWTYSDDEMSILCPEITMEHDLYDVPNVVEVTYSSDNAYYHVTVENNDPNSPVSTVNRGRKITRRFVNPSFPGGNEPTERYVREYAETLLKELSTVEYTISYTHGYCPTRVGDCIRFDYSRAGLTDIKAKVISQNIKCTPGCQVSEKAKFTTKLWR